MRQLILLLIFAVLISGGTVGVLYQEGIGGMAEEQEGDSSSEDYLPPPASENLSEDMAKTGTDSAADVSDTVSGVSSDEAASVVTDDAVGVEQPDITIDDVNQKMGDTEDDSVRDENGNLISEPDNKDVKTDRKTVTED